MIDRIPISYHVRTTDIIGQNWVVFVEYSDGTTMDTLFTSKDAVQRYLDHINIELNSRFFEQNTLLISLERWFEVLGEL